MIMSMKVFDRVKDEIAAHWNVDVLADEAGVAPATIYFWLSGKTKTPHLRTFIKVATAMGYRVDLVREKVRLRAVA